MLCHHEPGMMTQLHIQLHIWSFRAVRAHVLQWVFYIWNAEYDMLIFTCVRAQGSIYQSMEILSYLTNADYKIETKDNFQRSKHSKLHSFLLVLHSGVFHLSLNCIEYNIVLFFCKKRTYIQMYLWNIIFHMWNMKKN